MKMQKPLLSSILVCLLGAPLVSQGADADWKRGRVYYRMVCTACHVEKASAIAPSTKTMAEWNAYLLADKHAKGKDSVKYYVSKKYRDSDQGHQQGGGEVCRRSGTGSVRGSQGLRHQGRQGRRQPGQLQLAAAQAQS